MSEVKQWLMSIGIPGIERLADEFESRGFSSRKSLQYLQVGDLDDIFSSPKRLLLAEKRALDHELRQLKLKSQEPGSTAHLMPKQLQFSSNEPQTWPAEGETAKAASNSSTTTTRKIDSSLDRRKQELAENVSFLEAQISSAEDHLAKLKGENDLLQTVSAEEFVVTVISLAITGTIPAELNVILTLNVN